MPPAPRRRTTRKRSVPRNSVSMGRGSTGRFYGARTSRRIAPARPIPRRGRRSSVLQPVLEHFLELLDLGRDDVAAVARVRVRVEVPLVVVLGLPEPVVGDDLRHDGGAERLRGLESPLHVLGRLLLLLVVVEDDRAVLLADVVPL